MIKKPSFVLIIPEWENSVKLGTISPKYYKACNKTPDKIKNAYKVKHVMGDYYYVDDKGKPVQKKTRNVGKAKMWKINGQAFYSNTIHWKDRAAVVKYYHKYISGYIEKGFKTPFPTYLGYKLRMHVHIHELYSSALPDITNMWILPKMIEDSFVKCNILAEDSPEFRSATSFSYKFVNKKEQRKLVITFKYRKDV